MKILDRYIIKQMLAAFFYVVIILMVIITIIDVTENMDKFSEHHLSTGTIFIHYLTFIPWIAGMLIPITAFIAVMSFFLNGWIIPKSNRELLDFKMRYLQSRTSFDHRNMHMQALPDVY